MRFVVTFAAMKRYDVILCTSLGAGFCPVAPGTAGAVVGVLLWWIAAMLLPFDVVQMGVLMACIVVTCLCISPINRIEAEWGRDPARVVIDETVGVWLALFAVPQADAVWHIVVAFVLFRLLDITKPLGIRRLENLPGGVGVMMDDVAAGIASAVLLAMATVLLPL